MEEAIRYKVYPLADALYEVCAAHFAVDELSPSQQSDFCHEITDIVIDYLTRWEEVNSHA